MSNGASLRPRVVLVGQTPAETGKFMALGDFFGDSDYRHPVADTRDGSPSIWDMKGQTIAGGGLIGF